MFHVKMHLKEQRVVRYLESRMCFLFYSRHLCVLAADFYRGMETSGQLCCLSSVYFWSF